MNGIERKEFFENLDGLRFIAFFAIFCIHGFVSDDPLVRGSDMYRSVRWLVGPCWLGVNFFFCLSGFLITYLLVLEKERKGGIHIGKFYMRRILRIWPLYYALMVFGFILFPWLQESILGSATYETATEWMYWSFLSNFDQISNSLPYAPGLVVTWSLAVEEQFYLIWPLILTLIPLRYFKHLMIVLILVSLAFRLGFDAHEKHTLSCILDLSLGGLLAILYAEGHRVIKGIRSMDRGTILLAYVVGISGLYVHMNTSVNLRLFISLFMCFVIAEQSFADRSWLKMSNYPTLSLWGTWTFGLYILHPIALFIINNAIDGVVGTSEFPLVVDLIAKPVLAFILSIILAYVSYNFYERQFLKLKSRFKVVGH